jgi:hypothetical protein
MGVDHLACGRIEHGIGHKPGMFEKEVTRSCVMVEAMCIRTHRKDGTFSLIMPRK